MPIKRLSSDLIDEICGSFRKLGVLNLSHNEISRIEHLDRLDTLTKLVLSDNRIDSAAGLDKLTRLTHLDLRRNMLHDLIGLAHLPALESLHLDGNLIATADALRGLAWLPMLQSLTLSGNPLARQPNYREEVRRWLPGLLLLDGAPLTPVAAATPAPAHASVSPPSKQKGGVGDPPAPPARPLLMEPFTLAWSPTSATATPGGWVSPPLAIAAHEQQRRRRTPTRVPPPPPPPPPLPPLPQLQPSPTQPPPPVQAVRPHSPASPGHLLQGEVPRWVAAAAARRKLEWGLAGMETAIASAGVLGVDAWGGAAVAEAAATAEKREEVAQETEETEEAARAEAAAATEAAAAAAAAAEVAAAAAAAEANAAAEEDAQVAAAAAAAAAEAAVAVAAAEAEAEAAGEAAAAQAASVVAVAASVGAGAEVPAAACRARESSSPARAAVEGAGAADEGELCALRTENALLQLRLDAMAQLVEMQGDGGDGGDDGDDGGGGGGQAATARASQWRDKAFDLLVRVQIERRESRQQAAATAEALALAEAEASRHAQHAAALHAEQVISRAELHAARVGHDLGKAELEQLRAELAAARRDGAAAHRERAAEDEQRAALGAALQAVARQHADHCRLLERSAKALPQLQGKVAHLAARCEWLARQQQAARQQAAGQQAAVAERHAAELAASCARVGEAERDAAHWQQMLVEAQQGAAVLATAAAEEEARATAGEHEHAHALAAQRAAAAAAAAAARAGYERELTVLHAAGARELAAERAATATARDEAQAERRRSGQLALLVEAMQREAAAERETAAAALQAARDEARDAEARAAQAREAAVAEAMGEAAGLLTRLEAEAGRVRRAAEDAWRGAELQEEARSCGLERELGVLKRELAKSAVEQRALEREVVRVRAHAETLDRTKFEYLEEKLRTKDGQVLALRKERNALLASLRQLQPGQQGQQGQQGRQGPARSTADDVNEAIQAAAALQEEALSQAHSPPKQAAPGTCTTPRTGPGERRAAAARADARCADGTSGRAGGPMHSASVSPELLDELQALSQQLLLAPG